jgi:hypothetical protein
MPRDQEDLLLLLLHEGSRSQAIQLYREETGAGAADAREAVSRLAQQHGLDAHRFLLPVMLLLLGAIFSIVLAMAG